MCSLHIWTLSTIRVKFGYPPVKISGDIMTGPGVIDCEGGVAVALLAR